LVYLPAVVEGWLVLGVALDLHLVDRRFCLFERSLFLLPGRWLFAGSATDGDYDALVAILVDAGPQLLVTGPAPLLSLLQLRIGDHQFCCNVDGPVELHAHLHFLGWGGDAFTGVHCE
jgi:hypothetical protein